MSACTCLLLLEYRIDGHSVAGTRRPFGLGLL